LTGQDFYNIFGGLFAHVVAFIKVLLAFMTRNPWLLGLAIFMALMAGTSIRAGKIGLSTAGRSAVSKKK